MNYIGYTKCILRSSTCYFANKYNKKASWRGRGFAEQKKTVKYGVDVIALSDNTTQLEEQVKTQRVILVAHVILDKCVDRHLSPRHI